MPLELRQDTFTRRATRLDNLCKMNNSDRRVLLDLTRRYLEIKGQPTWCFCDTEVDLIITI